MATIQIYGLTYVYVHQHARQCTYCKEALEIYTCACASNMLTFLLIGLYIENDKTG